MSDIMKEIQELLAEGARQSLEFKEGMKELRASQKETSEQMKETDRKLKSVGIKLGKFTNNDGEVVEEYFYTALDKTNELHGEKYDYFSQGEKHYLSRGVEQEFDIIGYNGDKITAIEVKKIVHLNDVKKLIEKQLPFLKKFMSRNIDYKNHRIYGGIAGFKINKDAKEYAKKHGIIILTKNSENQIEELSINDEIKALK